MADFKFEELDLAGLYLVSPFFAEDERGYFLKGYEKEIFSNQGIDTDIFETFESQSKLNVIRGLHFQTENPQSKLVRCVHGKIFDVAVDIRKSSSTYGKWCGVYLDSDNKKELFIPQGFAHGFLSLTENSIMSYTCSGKYSKGTDSGIIWNDKDIGIEWPINDYSRIIVSNRDKNFGTFKQFTQSNHF